MPESPPPASGQNTPLSLNLYHDDDDYLPVTPPPQSVDNNNLLYTTPGSRQPSPSSEDVDEMYEKVRQQQKEKRKRETSSGFDPDGASNSSTRVRRNKRQKMFDAAEKRRIDNLITKAVKANEALNNVLRQRESNKKIPYKNESDNFNASSREVLQNLGGNYRYIGRRDDRLDRGLIFEFRGIDWNTNRVYLRCGEIDYRMTFQYFLDNFSKMDNNFGKRRKRKRKKVKRKRKVKKKVKRKLKKRKRKKVKRKRKKKVKRKRKK